MMFEMSLIDSVFDMACSAYERCLDVFEVGDLEALEGAREIHQGCVEFHIYLKNGGLIQ